MRVYVDTYKLMKYYDDCSTNYDKVRGPICEKELDEIITLGQIRKGDKTLDVGCGTCRYLIPLREKVNGLDVIGLDTSLGMLKTAKSKGQKCDLVRGDALFLPFKNSFFDNAIVIWTLHTFTFLKETLIEINRVLKDCSRFLIKTVTKDSLGKDVWSLYFPGFRKVEETRLMSVHTLSRLLQDVGFKIVKKVPIEEEISLTADKVDKFVEKARYRHISTFAYYSQEELDEAIKVFKADLESAIEGGPTRLQWRNYLFVCEKCPSNQTSKDVLPMSNAHNFNASVVEKSSWN